MSKIRIDSLVDGNLVLHEHKVEDIADIDTTHLKLDQSTPQTLTTSPIFDNLTTGRIPFASATKTLTDDSVLVWDNTNKRLGVGVTSPSAKLHVNGDASGITAILRANATTPSDILRAQNSGTTILASIASTGVILANYGLESAPGFSFQGDADTGLFRSAINTISTSLGSTTYVTQSIYSNNLLVQKDWPTYAYIGNSYLSLTGEGVTDTGMTGMYDRSETTNAAYRGTVTVTITGAGTFTDTQAEKNKLFDSTAGTFLTISGADATTTQVVIDIDVGSQLPNYNSANWQPFLQYRLNCTNGGTYSFFRNIDFKVSSNGVNYYAPATGWSTADFGTDSQVPSYWFGVRGSPSGITGSKWRYARITLTDLYQNPAYASKDKIWISQLGLRHVGAPWTTQYINTTGGSMYGALNIAQINASDANGLKLYDDGGNGIFVKDGGNIGIGTTSPDAKLHVQGSASGITAIFRANATTPGNLTEWQNSSGTPLANITSTGGALFSDKVIFTQTDGNEYIDSLNDGYMDYGATTLHRFNQNVDITGNCEADTYSVGGVSGVDGTFTTADGKTVTVTKGIITNIV